MKNSTLTKATERVDFVSNQDIPMLDEHSIWERSAKVGAQLETAGAKVIRYGLVLVIAWIGVMKFTSYEANAIQPLMANSPLVSWLYSIFSVESAATVIGSVEIVIAGLIAMYPVSRKMAAIGSALAMGLFLTTISFLFSTPGWESSLGGFPALSVVPGQFLIKDVVLLGAAIWSLGQALTGTK